MAGMSCVAAVAITAERELARATAADLDDRTGKRDRYSKRIAMEVALSTAPQLVFATANIVWTAALPISPTPLHRLRHAECIHQRLLDGVLGDQRQLQSRSERTGECRLARPGRTGYEDEKVLARDEPSLASYSQVTRYAARMIPWIIMAVVAVPLVVAVRGHTPQNDRRRASRGRRRARESANGAGVRRGGGLRGEVA